MEERVEAIARALVQVINESTAERRKGLRETAIHLLHDQVEIRDQAEILAGVPAAASAPAQEFNPFGIGLPLFLGGGVLIFLFPPVGLVLFLASALMMVWGVIAGLLRRR